MPGLLIAKLLLPVYKTLVAALPSSRFRLREQEGVRGVRPPLTQAFIRLGATTDVVSNMLRDVRNELRDVYADPIVDGEIPPTLNIGVSYDGTWLTGGHSSMYGVGCVIDILIGSQDFGLHYSSLLSDGDAKTFNKLCKLQPYGPEHQIEKQECVNHVGKRLGTALRTVVLDSGKQRQQLSGQAHGSLKSATINKLQKYQSKAIYRNKRDTKTTKTAIYATLLHSISTDKKPQHSKCPPGEKSWYFYQKALAVGRKPEPHSEKKTNKNFNSESERFDKENVAKFFTILDEEQNKKAYAPDKIFNIDDTDLCVIQSRQPDVIALRGKCQVGAMTSAECTQGRKTALSERDEQNLASNLKIMAKWSFPLSRDEVLSVVQEYVEINGIKTPFKNGKPGHDWFKTFWARHNLTLKKPEPLEQNRRRATSDPFIIYDFYDKLEKVMSELSIFDKPNVIWNLDETSFSCDPYKSKGISGVGQKFHRNITGSGSPSTTLSLPENTSPNADPPPENSFENSLLSKIKRTEKKMTKRKRVDPTAKVITSEEYAQLVREKQTQAHEKKKKGIPKTAVVKAGPSNTKAKDDSCDSDSSEDEEWKESGDSLDDINLVNPDAVEMTVADEVKPGDFVLVNRLSTSQNQTSSKPSTSTENFVISPIDISPVPVLNKPSTSQRERKKGTACVVTSPPYKAQVEASLRSKEKSSSKSIAKIRSTVSRKRQLFPTSEYGNLSDSNEAVNVHHSRFGDINEPEDDAVCIFYAGKFSDDTREEEWIQCTLCESRVHSACSDTEKLDFICDYSK
ncbi:hypothetical protein ANN_00623 [Periplaneta americana]|uniref:Mutator-like transposase domain-containing protein n=1 Tax=Periplaneta americana TaxID=6978 RepID=A0ABQ8TT03_PERAM|nr:hypothetical protein ANN_00623 [Periplaneta americana]